jgi:hypothetical protein
MNPRGRQFALGGTLSGWTRLGDDVTTRQRRTLRRVYQGREPRVYSRYGVRQYSAALPQVRVIVKDPFALLSLPVVTEVTGAVPVVLFRHPGALLHSYRRMGWRPAVDENRRLGITARDVPPPPSGADPHQVEVMAWFWSACYDNVLDDLDRTPAAVLVDHAELATGGDPALSTVMTTVGIAGQRLEQTRAHAPATVLLGRRRSTKPTLHNFQRSASEVAEGWRETFTSREVELLDRLAGPTWAALRSRRLDLSRHEPGCTLPGRGEA